MKFGQIFGNPFPPNLAVQKHEISAQFRTTSQLDCGCQQNATKNRQSENGIANYRHSRTGKCNLMYFGPQTTKNRTGVLTHPPAIVQRTDINKSVAFVGGDTDPPTRRPSRWALPRFLVCYTVILFYMFYVWLYSSRLEVPSHGAVLIWSMALHHPVLPVHDHHSRPSAAARCRHPSPVAAVTSRRSAPPCVMAMRQRYHQILITLHLGQSTSKNGRLVVLCRTRTTSFLIQKF